MTACNVWCQASVDNKQSLHCWCSETRLNVKLYDLMYRITLNTFQYFLKGWQGYFLFSDTIKFVSISGIAASVLLFTLRALSSWESSYLRWWSAHTNTNTAQAPPPMPSRPLIGQSAARWALIGWVSATLWSSIIGRREEKLSTLTWETVNNMCYLWNQLIASLQSVIDNLMEDPFYDYEICNEQNLSSF